MRWSLPLLLLPAFASAQPASVVFLHPDGTGLNSWSAARFLFAGPDGRLNWDRMERLAVYRGHPTNALTPSSNAGGTMHAWGTRANTDAFGKGIRNGVGGTQTIAEEALSRGISVGIVSSASITDAGTGTFLAQVDQRKNHTEIARQMLADRPQVLLGGGEQWFLPRGVRGRHGEGQRHDGKNLIEEARRAGYTVVFTREELLRLPKTTRRVLGLFAADDTFNDENEETLRERGLPLFQPQAPTYDEMVAASLTVLRANRKRFLLVAEEEGTDNFAGDQNAKGVFECLRRANRAIGIALYDYTRHRDTLILQASDSMCAGMTVVDREEEWGDKVPARDPETGAAMDGVDGTGTKPFFSAADRNGRRFPFGIAWATGGDSGGATTARAHGVGSSRLGTNVHATDLYLVMRSALFGERIRVK